MVDDFDLSQFITGSLCIRQNSTPAVRPVHSCDDPLLSLWKEDPLKILGLLPLTERKQVPEETVGTPVQEFYRGLNVFITGGSGFLGKVLVEKLLRDVPHIGHIYVLIREKRGKTCQERFQLLMEDIFFQRLKAEVPHYHKKITAVAGDISQPGLGLSNEDRQMIQDTVHVVFHCAADVRFLEPLRMSIESNVVGSKRVLDLAKQMASLKSYVHVSTAYSQCIYRVVEETVPKMSINYKEIIRCVDSTTDSQIEDNLKRTLQEWPNAYTFSKAMCEDMIQEEAGDLPICIFRPSVVANTVKEPFRGWTDNLYGIGGLMLAAGLGILHHYKVDESSTLDMVPVDYVINCMIAAAWSTSMKRGNIEPYVLNYTSSPKTMINWKLVRKSEKCVELWPIKQCVWYPACYVNDNYLFEYIFNCVHNIQGVVLDAVAVLVGQKPRLRKAYASIQNAKHVLSYFTQGFWEFRNENVLDLWHSMTKEDRQMFNFDVSDVNIIKTIQISGLGMRFFYLKESMESLPAAKRKMKWLRYAHNTFKLAVGFVVLKLAVNVARILPF